MSLQVFTHYSIAAMKCNKHNYTHDEPILPSHGFSMESAGTLSELLGFAGSQASRLGNPAAAPAIAVPAVH